METEPRISMTDPTRHRSRPSRACMATEDTGRPYLYAVACVEQQRTPFFDEIRVCSPVCKSGYDGDTGEMA